jgi:hypothetical protein
MASSGWHLRGQFVHELVVLLFFDWSAIGAAAADHRQLVVPFVFVEESAEFAAF